MSKEEEKNKKRYFWIILSVILFILLLGSIFLNLVLSIVLALNIKNNNEYSGIYFQKNFLEGNKRSKNEIAIIHLKGIISSYNFIGTKCITPEFIYAQLKVISKNKNIKGIILKIDSPGGSVTATDIIYNYIKKFKDKYQKPIIAYINSIGASGGYYIALSCDEIIAHPTSITGSIGVILSYYQGEKLLEEKLGIKNIVIKSGTHKDIGSFSRDITKEERDIFQNIINELYERFLEIVKTRKKLAKLSDKELKKIADGRIYTGNQAYKLGLIDKIGYFSDAIKEIRKLLHLSEEDYKLVEYKKYKSFLENLISNKYKENNNFLQILKNILNYLPTGYYYLYKFNN